MRNRPGTSRVVFYLLTGSMLIFMIVSFVGALSWINKPFAGFLTYEFPYVGSMSMKDWAGRRAGIKFLQRIISIDDQMAWRGKDLVDQVSGKVPGTIVNYKLEVQGELREFRLPVEVFSLRDFLLVFLMTYIGGIAIFSLGFVVFVLKPDVRASWVFFLYCLFLSLYMMTAFEIQSTYMLVEFHYLALCLMPACLFHLCLIFPERKRVLERFPSVEYLVYVPALMIALGYEIYIYDFVDIMRSNALPWLPAYERMASVNRLFTVFCVVSAIVFVVHSLFRASTIQARQRARMILFGVSIAFGPPVVIMLLGVAFHFTFPWNFLVFFVVFFPAAVAYSIARHNLFEADTIIRRTVGYAVVTAVVVGAYMGVSAGLNLLMGKYQTDQSQSFTIFFTLGVILIFNPLRDRIQTLVDRLFFRKEYDYGAIIEKIGNAITTLLDLGQVLKHLGETFLEDMFINTSSVMLLNPATAGYQVYLAEGDRRELMAGKIFKRDEPLMQIMETEKRELTKYDVLEDPKYTAVSKSCASGFEDLQASLMVPLVFQGRVIGLLTLGEKKSGKSYNRQDIDLLHAIANQGAVAIENARLFKENLDKQRMEEELAIARDLQMSMLPATCPRIEGFEIAAVSTPAREVGGDFFDFIDMGEKRVGLIVGDVTGKSVSGALVMAASRSIFRMLSEEGLNVSEIMLRANRRAKKDIKSGMFVALLYAVLDSRDRIMTLCSAGQTQPVYHSARTGAAKLVQTEGDTFPLGILDEADYQETRIQLERGDTLVFYTDGIVEALNEREEMFGFDRLLEIVQRSSSISSEGLLNEILGRVKEFAGAAAQHDDLTAIVIRVPQ